MPNIVVFRLDWTLVWDENNTYADANLDQGTAIPEGYSVYAYATVNWDLFLETYTGFNGDTSGWFILPPPAWLLDFQINITLGGTTNKITGVDNLAGILFALQPSVTALNFNGGNLISQFVDFNLFYSDISGLDPPFMAIWFGIMRVNDTNLSVSNDLVLTSITANFIQARPAINRVSSPGNFSNNAMTYYKPHSLPSCGVGSASNSRYKARRT